MFESRNVCEVLCTSTDFRITTKQARLSVDSRELFVFSLLKLTSWTIKAY